MTLKLRVTWPNAGTTLLPEKLADVRAEVGGSPLPLTSQSTGVREFDIPAGATRVVLKASFSVAFKAVGSSGPMTRVVLKAEQPYDVVDGGTKLEPVNLPAYVKGHPLVETHVASGANGAALARLRTEFVNITPFWMEYADSSSSAEYIVDHEPGTELVALGFTGGDPKIWFASVPAACVAPPRPDISCLVFYRPAHYEYTRVDQPHEMGGLNRYLLKWTDNPAADYSKRDMFSKDTDGQPYVWLRAGFEDALTRSAKAVVMIHPWASGLSYGQSAGPELPALAESVIRLLWAEQKIARNRGAIRLGRLGLAGYSAGGLTLWGALQANEPRVSEVYSFDARGAAASAGATLRWFQSKATTACLRMSGGHQIVAHQAIKNSIEKLLGGPTARVTALPKSSQAYDLGANPLWDYVLKELPALQTIPDVWHQFAICGGFPALPGPFAQTFFLSFLKDSDF